MMPSRARMLVATASFIAAPAIVRPQALDKVRIGGVPTDDMTPIYYAVRGGMYQKAGLDVEVVVTHRIDITTLNEPQLTQAVDAGNIRALGPAHSAISGHWVAALYLARPDWAKTHADVIRRWVRTTYESAAYCNVHESETIAMMADVTKIPVPVFQKMARIYGATTSDPGLLQPVIDLAVSYKALAKPFAPKDIYFSA
jgi:ABC-type nitrate/sulfonate/bicarbonate transport system substrate-binding protein